MAEDDNNNPDGAVESAESRTAENAEHRSGVERRKIDLGPPEGQPERRSVMERRKAYISEGRERYLDMVQKERSMLLSQGISQSTEQLLDMAGAYTPSEQTNMINPEDDIDRIKETASGDQLRSVLPVQTWLPLNIHLIGLRDGVLRIAPMNDLLEKQKDSLVSTVRRSGFRVDRLEVEIWDRAELKETLRNVHDLSADRCEKTLADWLSDVDNGLLLNQFQRDMLAEALQMRASDIHITQDSSPSAPNWIKYRIDGDLIPMHLLPPEAMARLTTLLKRDGGLNFGDKTTPKDGRFSFAWQGRTVDVRLAAGPQGMDGEKLTLRLLDRAALKGFEELFKRHEDVGGHLEKLLAPEMKGGGGLILLSGPTGSGKTTTLYACVQQIDRRRRHVLTIEDPIEYEMRYATQWQIRHTEDKSGNFASMIRAAMRHDPDYIIIGEMRDGETVETALKAAESGHTVITTVHADTAIQTFERLISLMPAERERSSTFTLAQQVRCILNQRLVKTLCQGCAHTSVAKDVLDTVELELLELKGDAKVKTHNSSGCDLCNRTGILGRTLLLDTLLVTSNVSERSHIFKALREDVHSISHQEGVVFHSRHEGVIDLVVSGLIDPRSAIVYMRE
ncbi:MAG: type II/IV secretion system family protein [Micavibrio sp.]|nr:type II/IV secretion system family protein [Micavibrio sp.]